MHTSLIYVVFLGFLGCANANCGGCPKHWVKRGERCYYSVSTAMETKSAQGHCKKLGGFLAEPATACENEAISKLSKTPKRRIIGFSDVKTEGKFVGITSEKTLLYTNWWNKEPNNLHNEDCVEIDFGSRGKWNDFPCRIKKPFVCQINLSPDWKPHNNMCYLISKEKVTWPEAKKGCLLKGGELVEPRTELLNTFLASQTKEWFWIGLSDTKQEGKYQWESDESTLGSFKPWDNGQPDDYKHNEDCIHNNHAGKRGKWNDRPCNNKMIYICQKPSQCA